MSYAQYFYKKRTGEDVFFGIGAYGNKANNNMGKCYKFIVETANRPFIAQVTNEGPDVRANQFDMVSFSSLYFQLPNLQRPLVRLLVSNMTLTPNLRRFCLHI